MIKSIFNDWKYVVMLLVTISGLFTPIWLTRFQSPEKDLVVQVISQSSLQPPANNTVSDLKLMLDGKELSNSYLTVLRITNEGSKPIVTKDFEAPLEMQLGQSSTVVRARVSGKSLDDIKAELDWDNQHVHLQPTLLNSQDSISIEILSTGGMPKIAVRSRIIGVEKVSLRNVSEKGPKPLKIALLLTLAFLTAIPAVSAFWRFRLFASTTVILRNRTLGALGFAALFSSEITIIKLLEDFGLNSGKYVFMSMFLLFLFALPFARLLEGHSKN